MAKQCEKKADTSVEMITYSRDKDSTRGRARQASGGRRSRQLDRRARSSREEEEEEEEEEAAAAKGEDEATDDADAPGTTALSLRNELEEKRERMRKKLR